MLVDTPRAAPPLTIPDFRLLWGGWTLIALAIQLYMIALVWLVLQLTGSGLELSTVLIAAAVPRAFAMLVSGVIIDRVSPRSVLVYSSLFSAMLVGSIALLLALDWMDLMYLFVIAALQGLMDAFFYPSAMAKLSRLVDTTQLAPANALLQTSDNVANILGPALGGFIIGAIGLPAAFLINTVLFLLGSGIVWQMRRQMPTAFPGATHEESFGQAIRSGMQYAWSNPVIRISLMMIALLNFAAFGPVIVGGAVLVEQRFGGDATMYGLFSASYGVGALLGGIGAGFLPQVRRPGLLLVVLAFVMGVGLTLIGFAPTFWFACTILALMGLGTGVVGVIAVSWMQSRTAAQMQGRMASLLIFSAVAVDPFSNAISGVLVDINIALLFVGAGALMLIGGLVAWLNPASREER